MTQEQKRQLREAIEKKITENEQAIRDLKEATKPMGLDSSIGRVIRIEYNNNRAVGESELRKVWQVSTMGSSEFQNTCGINDTHD